MILKHLQHGSSKGICSWLLAAGQQGKNYEGMSCPSWQRHRTGSRWSPVRTLPVVPLWCDLGFVPNSRGNKAAANLRPMKKQFGQLWRSSIYQLRLFLSLSTTRKILMIRWPNPTGKLRELLKLQIRGYVQAISVGRWQWRKLICAASLEWQKSPDDAKSWRCRGG